MELRRLAFLNFLTALFCATSISAFAQTNRGSISGTVTDLTGGVVQNATVVATETNTGTTYNTATSQSGNYDFPQLLVGNYEVTVSSPGFKTEKRTGIVVQINSTTVLNVELSVGQTAETVTVSADVPTVQSTSSEIGGVITPRQVEELPLSLGGVGAFRSPEAFEFLLPGVVGPGTGDNPNGIYIQKTSGGQNFGDDVILDGTSSARPDNGSTFDETAPSVDALQEFKVTTATPPAQYSRTTGGIRSFTTRSGGNSFHGTAYDILRNTDLDANTYFNNLNRDAQCPGPSCSTYATPKDIKNDYGVTLGGPVIIPGFYNGKDKTFFFFAWEQLQWPRGAVVTSSIPTGAERTGDFSAILTANQIGTNPCTGAPVYAGQIFDPRSTTTASDGTPCRITPFPGNIIPASRIDPVSAAVLSYLPEPNAAGLSNNFNFGGHFPTNNTTYTIRIDQNVSSNDKLFASYDARENTLLTGGSPALPNPIDPNTWNQDFITHYGRFGWDHIFTGNLLNHVNLGYNRTNSNNNAASVSYGVDWPAKLGLTGVSALTFPQFNINSGFPSIGQARGDDDVGNEADIVDTLSWTRGRHTITMGGEYRWIQYNNLAYDNQAGVYNFANVETAAGPGILANEGGFSFASFLLGQVDSANLNVFAHFPRYTSSYYALFFQDDFKVTPHLTLNLGLRWDVDQPRKEAKNYTSNFNPAIPNPGAPGELGALIFASSCTGCNVRWAKTFYDDFAPRIGFAWSPGSSGKTAVRGGYGIIYGPLYYADFANAVNAGYAATPNPVSQNGFAPAFTLASGFPPYPAPPILDPTIRNGQSVDYITPGFGKPPMVQSWSFQVQQQLAPDLILSVGYVGNKSQNLRSAAADGMYNNMPVQVLALGQNLIGSSIGSPIANGAGIFAPYPGFTGAVGDALRHYPQYRRFNTDCCLENDGMSTFEALEVTLARRFRNGLNLQASYTWSKTITDADSLQPCCNAGGGLYQDPYNLDLEKSISSQDVPQMFVLSYLYELPFGKGKAFLNRGGFLNAVFGGWQIGAIQRYQSGEPLPFYCASGSFMPGWDDCFRFNPVAGQSVYNPAINQPGFNALNTPYLNNNFFADPNPNPNAPVTFGQLSRVTGFRMQPYFNEDVNLMKRVNLTESVTLEIRADAFNVSNRHIFSSPGNLNPSPGNTATTNFGFTGGTIDTSRLIQLEMRLRF
jgi:hypothetical protein